MGLESSMQALLAAQMTNTVLGTFNEYQGVAAMSGFEHRVAQINARLADAEAVDIERRGAQEISDHRQAIRQLIGDQRADFAAQGIEVSSGSPLSVQEQAHTLGALDEVNIRDNTSRQAMSARMEALSIRTQDKLNTIGTRFKLTDTILTAGAKITKDMSEYASWSAEYGKKPKDTVHHPSSDKMIYELNGRRIETTKDRFIQSSKRAEGQFRYRGTGRY